MLQKDDLLLTRMAHVRSQICNLNRELSGLETQLVKEIVQVYKTIYSYFGKDFDETDLNTNDDPETGRAGIEPEDFKPGKSVTVYFEDWRGCQKHQKFLKIGKHDFNYEFPSDYVYMTDDEIFADLNRKMLEAEVRKARLKQRKADKKKERQAALDSLTPEQRKALNL